MRQSGRGQLHRADRPGGLGDSPERRTGQPRARSTATGSSWTGSRPTTSCAWRPTARYSRSGEGLHRFTDPTDGGTYLYSDLETFDAHRIYACFDQPDLKAAFQLSVAAPQDWVVLSNMAPDVRGEPAAGGAQRWHFPPSPVMSTYITAVVAGPLHSVRSEHDGIPLGLHCRRSLAPHLDADAAEILELTRQSLDHYHRNFGIRYPFDSYDQSFVPEFNAGAMENPGCVTFREWFVFRSAVTDSERQLRAMVIAHEMAHMWFGDLVTMRWWDDLWLNESFAEYLGTDTVDRATRFGSAWAAFNVRKGWGYDADQRPSTHPVAPAEVADTAQALQNFDGISYVKGASVLRQLVARLGEEAFLAGLNAYFAAHAFGNAELDDLLGALAEASGQDVRAWGERWLRTTGVDTLRVEGDRIVHTSADGVLRPHRITAGCYGRRAAGGRAGGTLSSVTRLDLDLPGVPDNAWAEPGADEPDLLLLNDTDLGFVKIRFDERSWQTVRDCLGEIPEELARAVAWEAVRDQVRDGELDPSEYLRLVAAHLPGEESPHLVEAVLEFARNGVADRYLAPELRPEALALIGGVCRTLLRRTEGTEDGSGLRLLAVRALISAALRPVDVAELQQWREEDTVPGGPVLDPDLRWKLLQRLCVLGAAGEPEIAEELVRDPSSTGAEGAARCRASLPEESAKTDAWHQLFHGDASNYLVMALAQGFWQPEQAELLAPWTQRYFDEVPAAAERRGPAVARRLGLQRLPAEPDLGAHGGTHRHLPGRDRPARRAAPPAARVPGQRGARALRCQARDRLESLTVNNSSAIAAVAGARGWPVPHDCSATSCGTATPRTPQWAQTPVGTGSGVRCLIGVNRAAAPRKKHSAALARQAASTPKRPAAQVKRAAPAGPAKSGWSRRRPSPAPGGGLE